MTNSTSFRMRRSVLLGIVLVLLSTTMGNSQIGLGGVGAIMIAPTARILQDGHVVVGLGYIPKPYGIWLAPDHDNLPYFATIGFLPFLEISFRATKALERNTGSMGDRMVSVRLLVLEERQIRPAFTVGLHDASAIFRRKEWFHSLYGVATKKVYFSKHFDIETTIGYGVDWISRRNYEFDGPFGGVSIGYRNMFFIKSEYDTKKFNLGLGFDLIDFLSGNFVLIDQKKLGFGLNFRRCL